MRKWRVDKCSEVEWSEGGWSLNVRKWRVDKCSEVEWSVGGWGGVKLSEVLNNRMSTIIRRYIDHMTFASYMDFRLSHSLGSIFYHSIFGCMCCMLLFNFVNCVFLFYLFMYTYYYVCVFLFWCIFCFVYSVSLPCTMYCLCVNVYCTAATGGQPNYI